MIDSKLILITLLVKLGIAAALSSALSRSRVFKDLLLSPRRSAGQMLGLLACICVPLTLGVWVRVVVPNFLAADISFEAVILVALLLGTTPAIIAGAFLSIPAMLHREYLTLPFNLAGRVDFWHLSRVCFGGGHLVFFSIRRPQHLSLDSEET